MKLQVKHIQLTFNYALYFGLIVASFIQIKDALNRFLSNQTTTTYFREPKEDGKVQ